MASAASTNNNEDNSNISNKNWCKKPGHISTFGRTASRIQCQISTWATGAVSATAVAATKDLIIVKEMMKMIAEDATGTTIGLVIVPAVIPGGDTGSLAKQSPRDLEK